MLRFCLIGHPLGHSISPEIQRRLFELSGVQGGYTLLPVEPDALPRTMGKLRDYDGFNVTIPYKRKIMPLLDGVASRAMLYGAVNTVVRRGRILTGYNTDAAGFIRALEDAGIPLAGRVLLCGTGGVAHMMAVEALDRGCSLTVASRHPAHAAIFAAELARSFSSAQLRCCAPGEEGTGYDLILNGTPAGMFPHPESSPVGPDTLRGSRAVFDAVYNPMDTVLLRTARGLGLKAQGGLPMLVGQAAASQTLWTGARFTPGQISQVCGEMQIVLERKFGS